MTKTNPSDPPVDYDSVAQHFVETDQDEKPQPVGPPPEVRERKALQKRFKKVRGYKPIERDLQKLTDMVVRAERMAGIYPEEE